MTVDDAYKLVVGALPPYHEGAFYGAATQLALGAGLIFSNLRQPAFDSKSLLYKTVRAKAYVITHECDTSQDNIRPFNDSVLVCPIIAFESFIAQWNTMPNLPAFLGDMAKRRVYRVVYLPPVGELGYGGILYLNRITSVHVTAFEESNVSRIGAVAAIGLREIDAAIQNLLLREKSDRLWGMPAR